MLGRLYLSALFFYIMASAVLLYVLAFAFPVLEQVANTVLLSLFGLLLLDILLLYAIKNPLEVERKLRQRMNLGDANTVQLIVRNTSRQPLSITLIEGYPSIMQDRTTKYKAYLMPGKEQAFFYEFRPFKRGEFEFSNPFIIIQSMFLLAARRIDYQLRSEVQVYPSVLQMKQYELQVFHKHKLNPGIKRIRRLGQASEFEQIKPYVQGDDIKRINWKATSRKRELMINQYQEERAQHVYFILDKGRSMQSEQEGLSLLDHAINATLVMANIALKKGDKPGLITYSNKIGQIIQAERSSSQLRRIQEALYRQQTHFHESDYELLYQGIRQTIATRSLLLFFTNFETEFAMRRAIPTLRKLNQKHALVVIFFENSGLQKLAYQEPRRTNDLYLATVAERMISMKSRIAEELNKHGIQTVLTLPENLSTKTINKYLELKARGVL